MLFWHGYLIMINLNCPVPFRTHNALLLSVDVFISNARHKDVSCIFVVNVMLCYNVVSPGSMIKSKPLLHFICTVMCNPCALTHKLCGISKGFICTLASDKHLHCEQWHWLALATKWRPKEHNIIASPNVMAMQIIEATSLSLQFASHGDRKSTRLNSSHL